MIVASMKANAELINVPLSKKRWYADVPFGVTRDK
jgi:hypothetical protein